MNSMIYIIKITILYQQGLSYYGNQVELCGVFLLKFGRFSRTEVSNREDDFTPPIKKKSATGNPCRNSKEGRF